MSSRLRTVLLAVISGAAFVVLGFALPAWLLFTMTKAIAFGLVALGIVALMRGGLVSFGQGLYYCVGAYVSGMLASRAGVTNIALLLLIGGASGGIIAAIVSPLIARYRGIFFAMLTMALSMVLYGVLAKMTAIGGTDGFIVADPTYFGWEPGRETADLALYASAVILAAACAAVARLYFDSGPGLVALASRENELRVEYLGSSVFVVTMRNFILAGTLAGFGGTLNGLALGHVDPFYAYWTTSGEVVFIAILGGHASAVAVFGAALITELVRSFANTWFPESWQLALGIFLLLVILFLPQGFGSLWAGRHGQRARIGRRGGPRPAPEAAE